MASKTLVVGATGLLGSIIYNRFKPLGPVFGTYFNAPNSGEKELIQLDARDFTQLSKLIKELSPAKIINCVGLASVEKCEINPEASLELNAEVPRYLAQITNRDKIQLIHISTDHYESDSKQPRTESEVVYPINQYGLSKLEGEKLVIENNPKALILRTNFFGRSRSHRNSLLDFVLQSLYSEKQIVGFTDVIFTPVSATEIANFLSNPCSLRLNGILNFGSKEVITKFEFLTKVTQSLGKSNVIIEQGLIANSALSVARPNYLALSSTLLEKSVGYKIPPLEKMIRDAINYQI